MERRCGESPMLVFRPDHMLELVLDTEQPTPIVPLGWQSGGLKGICGRKVASGKSTRKGSTHSRSVDEMAKGQLRSNREKKKKPKADKNKKAAPVASPFTPAWPTGQKTVGRNFS